MAIAYKSSGAGAGTETSGAALNLVCPATVDANDILIAHVLHTGTSTAPTTPSGWSLLYGPANVGTTATARHWCFGKLADGSEDGATISFGTAGGTNGRAGRIYSFSGYASGVLADVVPAASFSDIPHATDPQGPTVTTTRVGALAVALCCQDDNNTPPAITGMSGGTWAEQAEYVNATWGPQGIQMSINTCTPTSNPGTVSGGSIAITNDEAGTIGFEIRDAAPANVEVTPSTSTLTLTTFAPTVAVTNNVSVTPSTAALTLSTFAPTVTATNHQNVTPTTAALTVTMFTPTVTASNHQTVVPSPASLVLTAFAPTATTSNHQNVTPTTTTLTLTTFAPTVSTGNNQEVVPSTATLNLTMFAPTVTATNHQVVTPTPVSLSLSTFAPTVTVGGNVGVIPTPASLTMTTYAPTVEITTSGPTVYYQGGDDASSGRKKRRKRRDVFQDMERTIYELLHPVVAADAVEAPVPVVPVATLEAKLDDLLKLAGESHGLLQRAGQLRADLAALEAKRQEQDEEEFLMLVL